MFPTVRYGALLSLALSSCLQAAPQDQGPGPVISPTVDSMTMLGSGCPLGSGGIVREIRNNTPVFLFDEWDLNLADAEAGTTTVSKFCTEEISLGNGPQGYQVRIAAITVAGWADTDLNTRLAVSVETKLGGVEAGSNNVTLATTDLEDNTFSVDLALKPERWSSCVNDTGKVPPIDVKITVTLLGVQLAGGILSSGVVGGPKTDLKKALSVHFEPAWRVCPSNRI